MSGIHARHIEGWQWEMQARGHRLISDQSVASGGKDLGPMPSDLLLWSVASCFGMAVDFVAQKMRKPLEELTLEVSGRKDPHEQRFGAIRIVVSAKCPADKLRAIVQTARKYCYITNSLAPSVTLEFEVRSLEG